MIEIWLICIYMYSITHWVTHSWIYIMQVLKLGIHIFKRKYGINKLALCTCLTYYDSNPQTGLGLIVTLQLTLSPSHYGMIYGPQTWLWLMRSTAQQKNYICPLYLIEAGALSCMIISKAPRLDWDLKW